VCLMVWICTNVFEGAAVCGGVYEVAGFCGGMREGVDAEECM
jgi:hypothetical protein